MSPEASPQQDLPPGTQLSQPGPAEDARSDDDEEAPIEGTPYGGRVQAPPGTSVTVVTALGLTRLQGPTVLHFPHSMDDPSARSPTTLSMNDGPAPRQGRNPRRGSRARAYRNSRPGWETSLPAAPTRDSTFSARRRPGTASTSGRGRREPSRYPRHTMHYDRPPHSIDYSSGLGGDWGDPRAARDEPLTRSSNMQSFTPSQGIAIERLVHEGDGRLVLGSISGPTDGHIVLGSVSGPIGNPAPGSVVVVEDDVGGPQTDEPGVSPRGARHTSTSERPASGSERSTTG